MTIDAEPTEEERRNGWTRESLRAYRIERGQAQAEAVLRRRPVPPARQNSRYSPLNWRR